MKLHSSAISSICFDNIVSGSSSNCTEHEESDNHTGCVQALSEPFYLEKL